MPPGVSEQKPFSRLFLTQLNSRDPVGKSVRRQKWKIMLFSFFPWKFKEKQKNIVIRRIKLKSNTWKYFQYLNFTFRRIILEVLQFSFSIMIRDNLLRLTMRKTFVWFPWKQLDKQEITWLNKSVKIHNGTWSYDALGSCSVISHSRI